MKKSLSKDRQRRILRSLKTLQVDGVEVLQDGPADRNTAGPGVIRPLTPVPAYVLWLDVATDSGMSPEDFAPTMDRMEKRGWVRLGVGDPLRTPIIYRRKTGEVVYMDLVYQRLVLYPCWPIKGVKSLCRLEADDWLCFHTVRITDTGLDVLEDHPPVQGTLTGPQAAKYLGIGLDAFYALCRAGKINAQDMSKPGSRRRRWMATVGALDDFKAGRTPKPPQPAQRKRRGRQDDDVIQWY